MSYELEPNGRFPITTTVGTITHKGRAFCVPCSEDAGIDWRAAPQDIAVLGGDRCDGCHATFDSIELEVLT